MSSKSTVFSQDLALIVKARTLHSGSLEEPKFLRTLWLLQISSVCGIWIYIMRKTYALKSV